MSFHGSFGSVTEKDGRDNKYLSWIISQKTTPVIKHKFVSYFNCNPRQSFATL